jgi:hypothetical protein
MIRREGGESTSTEELRLDGVNYEIAVEERQNRYSSTWICKACPEQAAARFDSADRLEVVERAKANLIAHHTLVHRPPS